MTMHTATFPDSIEVSPGESGAVTIAITNTSTVINAYHVEVFGLDPEWVEATPSTVSLFPGDTEHVQLVFRLPDDYPASDRTVAVNVVSENDASFALSQVGLNVLPREQLAVSVDPIVVTGGRSATFGIIVANSGNAPLVATGFAIDPEDLAGFVFDPPSVLVAPGRDQVIKVVAKGGRQWFGQPRARTFTFGAVAETSAEVLGTFIQRPRISRWMLSLLGLLIAAGVFALVLSSTFDKVAEDAQVVDADQLDAALDPGEIGGARIPADPASASGRIVTSAGDGLSGVQALLFGANDQTVPLASAATAEDGSFAFSNLCRCEYTMQLSGAGLDTVWYVEAPDGEVTVTADPADATPIEVPAAADVEFGEVPLRGSPVAVAGTIDIGDAEGVTVKLIVPGQIDPTVDAVVGEAAVAPDGSFVMPDVPTPGDYVLVVEKPGAGSQRQEIALAPGQPLPELDISFNIGAGRIEGTVTSLGTPLDSAVISATDGTSTFETVSLSGPERTGGYELLGLPVPGRYTVTVSHEGHLSQTRRVTVGNIDDPGSATVTDNVTALNVSLTPSFGTIEGTATLTDPTRPQVITVSITGRDVERTIKVATQGGPVGTYSFPSLPAPESYTLTFHAQGMAPQVRIVTLDALVRPVETVERVVLIPEARTVSGTVRSEGAAAGLATVVLSNGSVSRTVQTANDPLEPIGIFRFSDVAPGTYTLSASLPGAVTHVTLIDINSSTPVDLVGQDFDLGPQAKITGIVDVFEERSDPPVRTELQRSVIVRLFVPEQFPVGQRLAEVTTDPVSGAFEFPSLAAGVYIVAVYESDTTTSPLVSQTVSTTPGQATTIGPLVVTLR